MSTDEFDNFSKKYERRLNEIDVINMLLDEKVRNYVIENDTFDFLALIAAHDNDVLRKFYFNEETIPYINELDKMPGVLFRSKFFSNKIKLLDDETFLESLTYGRNTHCVVTEIKEEIKKNSDNLELVNTLKEGLYKYFNYLIKDFSNNIKYISVFMAELPSQFYLEFLNLIIEDLKKCAIDNKDMSFNEIFSNYYLRNSSTTFNDIRLIIKKFVNIDNLYHSYNLIYYLVDKSVSYFGELNIDDEELNWLDTYIFNKKNKQILLNNFNSYLLRELHFCFPYKIVDFLLDDEGLLVLDKGNNFTYLFSNIIPYDKLMKSQLFAKLLGEYYYKWQKYDNVIHDIGQKLNDKKSFFNLLDGYIELGDYEHFFRIFAKFSSENQLEYFKNNCDKLFLINDCNVFKGMKKEVYDLYKDKVDLNTWIFTDYDLCYLLENKDSYSQEQLEGILKNNNNILTVANSVYLDKLYLMIINLGSQILREIYMSEEFLHHLMNGGNLDKVYHVLDKLEIDTTPLLLNTNYLIDVGEKVGIDYNNKRFFNYNKLPKLEVGDNYFYFLAQVSRLKNKEVLFKILDFYLTNNKYLATFCILRRRLKQEDLEMYLNSRRDLITNIIQNNRDSNLALILGGLPFDLKKNELFKERDNAIMYMDAYEYSFLFGDEFEGKYRIDEDVLNDDIFIEKFIGYYRKPETLLRLVTDNEELIRRLCIKIKTYEDMRTRIISNLNDSKSEFETYIKILINSNVPVFEIEFLKDMIDAVLFNKRIKEVFFKYKGVNLEKIKLEILSNVIKKSRESIAYSITNPLLKNVSYEEYTLNGKKVVIPTIIYDGEAYTFFVRRLSTGAHFVNGKYKVGIEYYSTITEKNRSMFNGDTGIKCGYININPNDIVHVNSFDAISQRDSSNKYIESYLKYPEWVSMEKLNSRTLSKESYNEIRVEGMYIPDFVISYDEPNENTLRYSYEQGTTLVKILRKSYPDAIENFEDPYSHWQ